ncbi:MAG: hypothetical protein IT285_11130 [Bdellovibrionales bacterium]|nr:hypothetical protein [Bdellovibrionales bacterium]
MKPARASLATVLLSWFFLPLVGGCNADNGNPPPKDQCADANRCLPDVPENPGFPGFPGGGFPAPASYGTTPGSSDWKILKAVEEGRISRDEAWVLQLEARFNPSVLPGQYEPEEGHEHSNPQLLNDVAQALPSLGIEAQRAVVPYLLPPGSPESYWHGSRAGERPRAKGLPARAGKSLDAVELQREAGCPGDGPIPEPFPDGEWAFVDDTFFRFWRRKNDPDGFSEDVYQLVMSRLRQALYIARNRYDAIMPSRILDDSGPHVFTDRSGARHVWCDGGNGKLDIYLGRTAGATHAFTVTYPIGCNAQPSFIVASPNRSYTDERFAEFMIAHELFHVYQFATERRLDCAQYTDADEGVANWAAHHAFPDSNVEHEYGLFTRATQSVGLLNRDYDTWPFYLAMVQKHGVSLIGRLYEAEAGQNPYRALNQVLPGGFRQNWPEFTLMAWNQEPRAYFQEWDQYEEVPTGGPILTEVKLDGRGEYFFEKEYPLELGLTRAYERFKLEPNVRTLWLRWTRGGVDEEDLHVRAMVKRGGAWETLNWDPTEKEHHPLERKFCFDEPGKERIQELVLTVSRSDIEAPWGEWTDAAKIRLRAGANNIPCYEVEGTASLARREESGTPGTQPYSLRSYNSSFTARFRAKRDDEGELTSNWEFVSASGNFSFEGLTEEYDPCADEASPGRCRRLAENGILLRGAVIKCSARESGSLQVTAQSADLDLSVYTESAEHDRGYSLEMGPSSPVTTPTTFSCSDGETRDEEIHHSALHPTLFGRLPVAADGALRGERTPPVGDQVRWDFR